MADDADNITDRTYENLARAGLAPLVVMDVLHTAPTVRRHIGARHLDHGEIDTLTRMIQQEGR